MNANENLSPKLLVVGGTSSLAPEIFDRAKADGYEIYASYRTSLPQLADESVNWIFLDFSSIKSIEEFILRLEGLSFSRVIFLAGKTSPTFTQTFGYSELEEYLRVQLVNPAHLLRKLSYFLEVASPSNLVYMSSRSAIYGSLDWPYGIAKAGLQNSLISLSKILHHNLSVVSVASGLVLGSTMQESMQAEIVSAHIEKADLVSGSLLTVPQAAQEIWNLTPESTLKLSGKILEIGPVY